MSAHVERPPEENLPRGGFSPSSGGESLTLASLPVGARIVLRCRKDWRDAVVVAAAIDQIVLSVGAPSGRTYRVRRPPDSLLSFDGPIPLLGEGTPLSWRVGRVRYDARW